MTADDDETKSPQTLATIAVVISVTIGIVWNVLAALILFRSYSFFEAVVVSLLVMRLSSVATRCDLTFASGGTAKKKAQKRLATWLFQIALSSFAPGRSTES